MHNKKQHSAHIYTFSNNARAFGYIVTPLFVFAFWMAQYYAAEEYVFWLIGIGFVVWIVAILFIAEEILIINTATQMVEYKKQRVLLSSVQTFPFTDIQFMLRTITLEEEYEEDGLSYVVRYALVTNPKAKPEQYAKDDLIPITIPVDWTKFFDPVTQSKQGLERALFISRLIQKPLYERNKEHPGKHVILLSEDVAQ